MRKVIMSVLAALAASVYGFTPQAHTNTVTRDGVTYVQRGALGTADYVVTNVDAQTVGRVQSVNGKTGTVVLGASDVQALPDNYTALTNNTNFKSAVENVSPPTVLPEKWALANVTNKNGGAVTAKDVGAWSTEKSNATTNWWQELVFNLPGSDERWGYIKTGMETNYGGEVSFELFSRYNDYYKMISIDTQEIFIFDGENSNHIDWNDILCQYDVQQAWSQLWNKWEKPISAKGVYTYLTNQYYTSHLDTRYYTKNAADLNFLSKLTAAADYMAKTGTYNKAEIDANFLNVTSRVEKIYANDASRYINGRGEVYDYVSTGYYWDLEDSYYHDHFIFVETNGVDGFYCPSFEGMSQDARLKFEPSRNKWCLYVPASQTSPFSQHNGTADSTTIEIDPFGTATKHSAGGSFQKAGDIALKREVTQLWNDTATAYQTQDGKVMEQLDGFWCVQAGTTTTNYFARTGADAWACPQSTFGPMTLTWANNVWTLNANGTMKYANGSRDAESFTVFWFAFSKASGYTQTKQVAYSNEVETALQGYVPTTRKVNGQALTSDITIQGMTADAVVLTNGTLKTYDGRTVDAMDYPALTNTVNAVKAQYWDAPLAVNWTVDITNGDMHFSATTNVNQSVLN